MERSLNLGQGRWAHCSGALYLEEGRALVIADAHLGYAHAQRRRGQLGPLQDGGIVAKLIETIEDTRAALVLFLGDTVHAPRPSAEEKALVESALAAVRERAELRLVEGNHDRAIRRDFAHLELHIERYWRSGGILALHGDRLDQELPEAEHYLIGHVHPAIGLRDHAGARTRIPAFLVGERATVLPAFSPFAAGLDITKEPLTKEITQLLGRYRVAAATGSRVAEVPRRG